MSCFKRFVCSFGYAAQGVLRTIMEEQNMRFHLVAAGYVLYFSRFYPLQQVEKALLFLTIGLVICAELGNTAIENVVDLCSPGQHPLAKAAKDAAAGGVLVATASSVLVGICLFARGDIIKIIFYSIFGSWKSIILFLASAVAGLAFVFIPGRKCKKKQEEIG